MSVALCTRNGARHLEEQLRSVLSGTVVPDEIVVVDDASTDGSAELATRVLADAPSARVERNAVPLGVTRNFERALSFCTGDVLVLCDQDDRWHPTRLEEALRAIERADLIHSDADLIDDDGRPLDATLFQYLRVSPSELVLENSGRAFDALLRRNTVTGATVALRRPIRDAAMPFPEEWVHDEWLALVAATRGSVALAATAVDYRLHGRNAIGAERPTLRRRIQRAVGADPTRNSLLAAKWGIAVDRLGATVSPDQRRALRGKAAFEARRARLPRVRILRLPEIVAMMRAGDYRRFASQGRLDALRDALQPR